MDRSHDPQIDDRERVQPETAEIVVDRAFKLRRRHRRVPRGVGPAFRANFRHDDKIVGIGVQGLADQLVRDIGAIIVAGVDMIDAARDRLAQDLDRPVVVLRRPEHPRTRELHSAVAHALHNPVAERKRSGSVDHGLLLDRPRIPPRRQGDTGEGSARPEASARPTLPRARFPPRSTSEPAPAPSRSTASTERTTLARRHGSPLRSRSMVRWPATSAGGARLSPARSFRAGATNSTPLYGEMGGSLNLTGTGGYLGSGIFAARKP